MSSFTRRCQIRALKKAGKNKLAIVSNKGNVLGLKWAVTKGQLFFLADFTPIFPHSEHPTLQSVIDALSPPVHPAAAAA